MHKTVVINAVGLTPSLLGPSTPRLLAFSKAGKLATIGPVLPAVTTTVQSTYLTGAWPSDHGIVANGWYFRDECEIKFWRQSNKLVSGAKIWDHAKAIDPRKLLPFSWPSLAKWAVLLVILGVGLGFVPEYRSKTFKQKQKDAAVMREVG